MYNQERLVGGGLCLMFIYLPLHQVVEAVLWKFTLQYDGLFCADSTLAEIVEKGLSTSSLWLGKSFSNITKIFVPIIVRRIHWTLLVGFLFNLIELVCCYQFIANAIDETGYMINLR